MDTREKLIELLTEIDGICPNEENCYHCKYDNEEYCFAHSKADFLISHGVTVQEWYPASNPPKEDGTYIVQTNTGTITTARFYAFKSFPATSYLPAIHRSPSWQSNRNVVKWTFLPQPPKGE